MYYLVNVVAPVILGQAADKAVLRSCIKRFVNGGQGVASDYGVYTPDHNGIITIDNGKRLHTR